MEEDAVMHCMEQVSVIVGMGILHKGQGSVMKEQQKLLVSDWTHSASSRRPHNLRNTARVWRSNFQKAISI